MKLLKAVALGSATLLSSYCTSKSDVKSNALTDSSAIPQRVLECAQADGDDWYQFLSMNGKTTVIHTNDSDESEVVYNSSSKYYEDSKTLSAGRYIANLSNDLSQGSFYKLEGREKVLLTDDLECHVRFEVPVEGEERSLTSLSIGNAALEAVDTVYYMGRDEADSGGISSLEIYENNGHQTFFIMREIMFNQEFSSALPVAEITCSELDANICVRKVLERSEDVQANYQHTNAFHFINDLRGWGFESEEWGSSLDTIEGAINGALNGREYKTYAFGYDYIADVFTIVMITTDKKTVIVVSGDLGA